MIVSLLAISFALGFDDGQAIFRLSSWLSNFLRIFLIVAFSVLAKEIVRKLVSRKYDCAVEYRLWETERYGLGRSTRLPVKILGFTLNKIHLGFWLPVIIAFLSLGKFPFIASGIFIVSTHLVHRAGKKYLKLTEYEEARIALSAVLTSLALAFIFKFLTPINQGFEEVVTINALLAFYHILPFPELDGAKIFFAGRTFYIFNLIFVISSAFMISYFSVITSIILSVIFAIILAVNYHYFLRYK